MIKPCPLCPCPFCGDSAEVDSQILEEIKVALRRIGTDQSYVQFAKDLRRFADENGFEAWWRGQQ